MALRHYRDSPEQKLTLSVPDLAADNTGDKSERDDCYVRMMDLFLI